MEIKLNSFTFTVKRSGGISSWDACENAVGVALLAGKTDGSDERVGKFPLVWQGRPRLAGSASSLASRFGDLCALALRSNSRSLCPKTKILVLSISCRCRRHVFRAADLISSDAG